MQISQKSTCVADFFKKVAGPQNCNFIKKRLQHKFYSVKFVKFLETPYFAEYLQWLLLTISGFQPPTLLKKRLPQCFSVSFTKLLRTSFLLTEHLRMTASCICLWILRSFSEHFFYRAPLENCLFDVQVVEFQPPDTVKYYFTCAYQVFYTRTRSSHSKASIFLKSQKTICEDFNL